jgi:RNA methyltransferase, TrmH family
MARGSSLSPVLLRRILKSMKIVKRQIQYIRSLHTKKGRAAHKVCCVEGIRAICSWLAAGHEPHMVYMVLSLYDTYASSLSLSPDRITVIDDHTMGVLSTQATPSGILALFPIPEPAPLPTGRALILAGLQDPGNVGTLIRTALALQVPHIVFVDSVDPWSSKVIQASAGTIASARISMVSWPDLIAHIPADRLAALVPRGGVAPGEISAQIAHKLCIVVGNEGSGLPHAWQAHCGYQLTLPMPGSDAVESLNAAVAGALALYALYCR